MSDFERFETVLRELAELWLRLGDLAHHMLVIGGQVIALEARRRGGDGVIRVETPVGPVVERGYSLDLDLLYDGEAAWCAERLPEVLRSCGFVRSTSYRWTKLVGGQRVDIDLLASPGAEPDQLPVAMTRVPGGDVAFRRPRTVDLRAALSVAVPSPLGFLALKVAAKKLRPEKTKDCFDLYAYSHLMGAEVIAEELRTGGRDGEQIRERLTTLFADENAPGVRDVLAYAGSLEPDDRELLARSVLDLMADATRV